GPPIESCDGGEGAGARVGTRSREIRRREGRALWADAGGRASGERRRGDGRPRNVASVAAGGRALEPRAETPPASAPAGTKSALRRAGPTRWQLSSLV